MSEKLDGKVAVVTGASKGIGAGIALGLGAAGASVVVNYATDQAGADRVVEQIGRSGGRAVAVGANVSIREEVNGLIDRAAKAFGPIDILVNNASIFRYMPLEKITESEFHQQFDINVLGTILVTQAAVLNFNTKGGSIINISSLASTGPKATQSVYAATKASVNMLTAAFALELAPRGIRVNGIMPGYTDTEGARAFGVAGTEYEKQLLRDTPLGRAGVPADFAPVAVFLASDASGWITGETIRVAGGLR